MKKTVKLMKTSLVFAMAGVLATSTAIKAYASYASVVRVEHIWEDDGNSGETRPDSVTETIVDENSYTTDPTMTNNQDETAVTVPDAAVDGYNCIKVVLNTGDDELTDEQKEQYSVLYNKWQIAEAAKEEYVKNNDVEDDDAEYKKLEEACEDALNAIYGTYVACPTEPSEDDYTDDDGNTDEQAYSSAMEAYKTEYAAWEEARTEWLNGYKAGAVAETSHITLDSLVSYLDGSEDYYKELDDAAEAERAEAIKTIESIAAGKDTGMTSEKIYEKVVDIVEGTQEENLWAAECEIDYGVYQTYTAELSPETVNELAEAGYTTTQMRIQITVVNRQDLNGEYGSTNFENARVYASVDGGLTWVAVNEAANNEDYNPSMNKSYVVETVITFLHTRDTTTPVTPSGSNNSDPDEPSDEPGDSGNQDPGSTPETTITDEGTPLAEISDMAVPLAGEAYSDIPDEDVPLAEIPKTSDDDITLWMMFMALAGGGLICMALTGRKRKEGGE